MAYEDMFRLSAHAVITDAEGKVLLLYANYNGGFWGLPGGAIEPGETIDQTLVRECQEELGVAIKILYLSGVYYHKKHNSHVFIFRCELPAEVEIKLSPEHSKFQYMEIAELSDTQSKRVQDCLSFNGEVRTAVFE